MNEVNIVYNGEYSAAGLTIQMMLYNVGFVSSIHIRFWGTVTIKDPFIYKMDSKYAPFTTHRITAYNGSDLLVYGSGDVRIGAHVGSNYQNTHSEIGYSWLCKNIN